MTETPFGVNLTQEKLLALVVLSDDVASIITASAGEAFFRAFAVENRTTGEALIRFRFRYKDHDSWYTMQPRDNTRDGIAKMVDSFSYVIRLAIKKLCGIDVSDNLTEIFYPPDDDGDSDRTLQWLIQQDLVTVREEMVN
jgi:hypothetical protein